uniref:small monomeric GTPase n=1 Tax=Nothobranchius pienaari TaxID=704102 RepID=A0A1A8M8X5_9TELE
MAKQYDILFRLLILGDSGVGKTCMLRRFTDGEFDPSHISTIGVDFKMKTVEIDGIRIRWASDVDEFAPDDVQTVLVGNKADNEFRRQVTKDQGYKLAEHYGMEFFETSASTSSNINELFIRMTELVLLAHRRNVDDLLGSLDDYLDKAALEEEKGSPENGAQRTCAC